MTVRAAGSPKTIKIHVRDRETVGEMLTANRFQGMTLFDPTSGQPLSPGTDLSRYPDGMKWAIAPRPQWGL
ncbi:hypothetical protein HYS54_04125 [Candidatus Micrarchaeota archaeon]|nr:hypothetical protein [Candidatus Micrarchaeota archaeon]